jgi:hypothetical protein
MTATDFFGRLRAAQALNEDFDAVVEEFGRGCPCKNPPLKSTGKAHLKSTTHDKAFNKAGGKFFGMTVRAALMLPVDVVHVQGAQRIGGEGDGGVPAEPHDNDAENPWMYEVNEVYHFDEMDNQVDADDDARLVNADDDADEDLSDIVMNEE